jgi:putative phosphoribosyl transferase
VGKMSGIVRDRTEAGKLLASKLETYANRDDVIVLGLPRGGVVVAFEIAKALNVELDICAVRKLGFPKQPELAMGAIAMGGVVILNRDVMKGEHIPQQVFDLVLDKEKQELERRDRLYRGDRPFPELCDKIVILVDDGIATGSTLQAAIAIVNKQQPRKIIVAVPVAPHSVCKDIEAKVDELICLKTPKLFDCLSIWYEEFPQTTDEEVEKLLGITE